MLKKQNGRYASVGTPSTAPMNAPHEFHGTSGEVTVPLSAASRDRFGRREAALVELHAEDPAGSTSAMYWSPAKTFSPKRVANTVKYSRPVRRRAARIIGSIRRLIRPKLLQQGAEGHGADDQPQREQHAVHAAAREQPVDVARAGIHREAGRHRLPDRRDGGPEAAELGSVDEVGARPPAA